MKTLDQYKAARRVSVPLIVWKTPDAAATIQAVMDATQGPEQDNAMVQWDVVRGMRPLNKAGQAIIGDDKADGNPLALLEMAQSHKPGTVVFMHNAQMFINNDTITQGIWNLRDTNKAQSRMLVMLAPQIKLPIALTNDVVVLDEALPDEAQLSEIVKREHTTATGKEPKPDDLTNAVKAINGLSAFAAEQVVAMSFQKNGSKIALDYSELWERKRQTIEETRGLKVFRSGETFEDVRGVEQAKLFLRKVLGGRLPPSVIVFVDEIEKQLGGATGDTTGVTQDQLGIMLQEMQNKNSKGLLFIGHPGSAKSMLAKATGNTAGIPTIALDFGGMKEAHVGDSEANIRTAVKVIDSVSQGRALYIATCNNIGAIPPELQRRFSLGTFFFDLPSEEERAAIWDSYLSKYELTFTNEAAKKASLEMVDDEGWTGADIANCCERAWMFNSTIKEAAQFASPIIKTNPKQIEALRNVANNSFLSASHPGLYQKEAPEVKVNGRKYN